MVFLPPKTVYTIDSLERRKMLLTLKQASEWASKHINKNVTPSNISYLIQYAQVKYVMKNGAKLIPQESLIDYYASHQKRR